MRTKNIRREVQSMTEGNPAKLIFLFAIPLMLGNLFQQVYTITDTIIVSRGVGVDALAALGSADWYNYMMLGIVQGVTQGFAILMAQFFGAKEYENLRKTCAHSVRLCVIIGILLTILAQLSVGPVLSILNVNAEIRGMAELYIRIIFAGIPAQMLYNFCASELRALGNSRDPLIAIVTASLLNIVLDLLFVLVLPWGIAGAAAATILSQAVSGIYCLLVVRKVEYLHFAWEDGRGEPRMNERLLKLAWPVMLMNIIISVGGMIVNSVVNQLGVAFLAGYTATNKLYGALEMAAIAYGYAMLTYIGQNLGAGKHDRIRRGFRDAVLIGVATSVLIGGSMIVFRNQIVGLFIASSGEEAKEASGYAVEYLVIMSATLFILYILYIARSTLQGLGNTRMPMISGLAEFAMRTFMALVVAKHLGGLAIMWGEVAAWIGADLVLVGALIYEFRRLQALEKREREDA